MTDDDDFTIAHGSGTTPERACVMQRAALQHAERHGYLTGGS